MLRLHFVKDTIVQAVYILTITSLDPHSPDYEPDKFLI